MATSFQCGWDCVRLALLVCHANRYRIDKYIYIYICLLFSWAVRVCAKQVGLAIEGGGMRGCVSAGMIATLYNLDLMDTFDAVYGSSAGSLVGAYAIAGQVGDLNSSAHRHLCACACARV